MTDRKDYKYVAVQPETKQNIEKLSKLTNTEQYKVVDHAVASLLTDYIDEFEDKYRDELNKGDKQ
jgi:hypothetical protein